MPLRFIVRCVLAWACFAGLAGCQREVETEVSGRVKIDGVPLTEGEIIFEAENQDATPEAAEIAQGQYLIKVAPGKKVVRINASRPTKIPDPVMGSAAREAMIEPEFNLESTLKIEVKPGKQSGVDFEVRGIP